MDRSLWSEYKYVYGEADVVAMHTLSDKEKGKPPRTTFSNSNYWISECIFHTNTELCSWTCLS